ncbi:MAG: hypothetical protein HGGPFJEG_00512 [Ignavibacteria bacterium]|nr:hypothetical protein [Ignavibacteria bacterium]
MPDALIKGRKISIVIPALNEEKLIINVLKQFNESIKKDYDVEIIVSDGGSSDNTVNIAGKYADKVLNYNKEDSQNISRGRNEGARKSQGDVLIFLNADTRFENLKYILDESLREIYENNVKAIACAVYVYPEEELLSDKIFHFLYNKYTSFLVSFFTGMGRGECHIIEREIFFKIGGYNESIIAGEDFELYMRLKKAGKLKFRNDFVIYESPRRYRKYGYLRILWEWLKNSLSVFFFGKSVSVKWEEVR